MLQDTCSTSDLRINLRKSHQATELTCFDNAKGIAEAYPTTRVAPRLLCLVLNGGAAHIPIDDRFDSDDIMARLDTGT
jgi:hypothetical protein